MIFIAFSLGQLAYSQLDIAAELLRETLQLQFFSLFGGIAEVFLKTRFGSIDSRGPPYIIKESFSYNHCFFLISCITFF